MKTVCVVIGSRANYASIKSFLKEAQSHAEIKLEIIANCSAVLDRFGTVADVIEKDGFPIRYRFYSQVEGSSNLSMVRTAGLSLLDLGGAFEEIKPDLVITIGDRYETISTAIAASYLNIPLGHTMGGEVTGTIDESVRHAVTKLSHIHFAANEDAKRRIIKLGEDPKNVFNVGCPRIDEVRRIIENDDYDLKSINEVGTGDEIEFERDFVLFSFHPVTSEYDCTSSHIINALEALNSIGRQAVVLWPNADAGSDSVSREIRKFQSSKTISARFIKNLKMNDYIGLMKNCSLMLGNSSSGIREGAFIGTKVINIGSRQHRRLSSGNCINVENSLQDILRGVSEHNVSDVSSDHMYGDGYAGKRMVEIILDTEVNTQKVINY